LQHGLQEERARSHRWVRSQVPHRRRRRRRLLALDRARLDHRLPPGGARVAPSAELDPHLLEAAGRLRAGRGAAGREVAREAQRRRAHLPIAYVSPRNRVRLRAVIALLHVLQPIARLVGRVKHGLTLWRRRGVPALVTPRARTVALWSEHWRAPTERLAALESWLREQGQTVVRGGDWDRWDLELRQGCLAAARLLAGTEEHGRGRQLTRFRVWARWSRIAVASVSVTAGLAVGATAA